MRLTPGTIGRPAPRAGRGSRRGNPSTIPSRGSPSPRDRAGRIAIGGSATPGTYEIGLRLAAEQTDGAVKQFVGAYTVGPENGALKILAARVASQ